MLHHGLGYRLVWMEPRHIEKNRSLREDYTCRLHVQAAYWREWIRKSVASTDGTKT